jgi:hypothetical protein
MSTRFALLWCLFAFACTDQPITLAADGGAPRLATNSWIVRRMTHRVASSELPALVMPDAGRMRGIIPVSPIRPDSGMSARAPEVDAAPPPMAPDAGRAMPPPEVDEEDDDAGVPAEPPCNTPSCLCNRLCQRGLALECPEEDTLEVCVEQCAVIIPGCYDPMLRLLHCMVELPAAAYSCDPELEVFVVDGCTAESSDLDLCSF